MICWRKGRSNLSDLIPFINQEEVNRVKEEISGKQVALIFDGTTHVAEALVIVLRYVTGNWEIRQRVCRLKLLAIQRDFHVRDTLNVNCEPFFSHYLQEPHISTQ